MRDNFIALENIGLDDDIKDFYDIGDNISIFRSSENKVLIRYDDFIENCYESNIFLFYSSVRLSFPQINVKVSSKEYNIESDHDFLKRKNSGLYNYYATESSDFNYFIHSKNGKKSSVTIYEPNIIIGETEIDYLKSVHKIIIEHTKQQAKLRDSGDWKPTRWFFAQQRYLIACESLSLELSIMYLITALESLLSKNPGELTYKVSLFSSLIGDDDKEKREDIFNLVSFMYNIRSKVSHGDVDQIVKLMQNENIYHKYYRFKEIVATIIIKLYGLDSQKVFDRFNSVLFNAPSF